MFVGILSFSIAAVNKVEIGLDQKLSMPDVSCCGFCHSGVRDVGEKKRCHSLNMSSNHR